MSTKTNGLRGMFFSLAALLVLAPATGNADDCGAGSGKPVCGCGDTVVGNATLTSDLTCLSGIGLTIGANDIILDGGGHVLDGSSATGCAAYTEPTSGHIGVYNPGYDGVEIKNFEIENFCKGIFVEGASDNVIEGNEIHHCGYNGTTDYNDNGLLLKGAVTGTTVQGNHIHDIKGYGTSCTSGGNGVFLEGPNNSGNEITNNCIHDNDKDGILLRKRASSNYIAYNEVWENDGTGIVILCKNSNFNTVEYNCSHDNGGHGIHIGGNYNDLFGNIVFGNGGDGIHIGRPDVYGAGNNYLEENESCDNTGYDVYVKDPNKQNDGDENTCGSTYNFTCSYNCAAPYTGSCPSGCGPCDDCGGVCDGE